MNKKWLFGGTLAAGIVALSFSSAALADDDQYCVRRDSHHRYSHQRYSHQRYSRQRNPYQRNWQRNGYADRYATYGNGEYGAARPYDSFESRDSRNERYGSRRGGDPNAQYRDSQPDPRYAREEYGGEEYGSQNDGDPDTEYQDSPSQSDPRSDPDAMRGQRYDGRGEPRNRARTDRWSARPEYPTYPN